MKVRYRNGSIKDLTPREFVDLMDASPAMRADIEFDRAEIAGLLDDMESGKISDIALDELTSGVVKALGAEEFYERLYKEIEDELGGEALLGLIAKAVRRS